MFVVKERLTFVAAAVLVAWVPPRDLADGALVAGAGDLFEAAGAQRRVNGVMDVAGCAGGLAFSAGS